MVLELYIVVEQSSFFFKFTMFESEVKNMKNDEKVTNINAVQWQIDNYFKTTVVFFKKKFFL